MSEIKERIIGALSIMSDDDAKTIWSFIQDGYIVKLKTWDDIEEDEATEDELEIIAKYQAEDENFLPAMTLDEVRKELNI